MTQYKVVRSPNDRSNCTLIDSEGAEIMLGNNYREFEDFAEKLNEAYKRGMKKGIWLFAWWKDGVQYCGAGLKTLKEALNEVEDGSIY